MEKLKIGMFIDTFFPMLDGVIMVVDNYAKRLNKIADVTVFCPKGKDKKFIDNFEYKVVRCKSLKIMHFDYTLPTPKFDKKFKKTLKEANLDVVHIHSPMGIAKMAIKYAKKHKIPCAVTLHSQFKQDIYKITHSKILTKIVLKKLMNTINKCDIAFAVNGEIQKLFVDDYGLTIKNKVIPNATELEFLPQKEENRAEIRKKYNILDDEYIFLFVGRLNLIKNLIFLVDSLKVLKDNKVKFKMLFVGDGQDENKLKEHIKKCGLENNCIMCGKITSREQLAKIYSASHLFLFPSLYDASSLVQVEAASQKTPTVFIEGARTAGTVTKDVNGLIAKNDVNSYAKEIEDILSDEERYKQLCENAYRDLYVNWDMVTQKVYDEYLKLIQQNNLKNYKKDV